MEGLVIYGKHGCGKCENLKKRLDRMNIEYIYKDILDPTGKNLVDFCKEEKLNPNSIPALAYNGRYLQTDYSTTGVITPTDIEKFLGL